MERIRNFVTEVFEVVLAPERMARVFISLDAGKQRLWRAVVAGIIYFAIAALTLYLGNAFGFLKQIDRAKLNPLWAILYAPLRETLILILLVYFLRISFFWLDRWPVFFSLCVATMSGAAFGIQHASEAINQPWSWLIMRFVQTGATFFIMTLQWEATLRRSGQTRAFFAVVLSHFINNLLIFLLL